MATTEGALMDRIRGVLEAAGFAEAVGRDFAKTPATAIAKRFIVAFEGTDGIGGFNFTEDVRGRVQVELARPIQDDYPATVRTLYDDARVAAAAIVRDGAVASGEYAVEMHGRTVDIEQPPGAAWLRARLILPVSFEAVL